MGRIKKARFLKGALGVWMIGSILLFWQPIQPVFAATSTIKQDVAGQELKIFKRIEPNKNSIKIADQIVNNQYYVNSIFPVYAISGKITWKEDPFNNATWCFYFHSLDMVGYLMNAYELNPKQEYLEKSKWLIESWMKANPSPANQASPSAWDDHSTANRVTNIVYFWEYYKNSTIYDQAFAHQLMDLLEKHGEFLADDQYYSKGNNHGIFQDRSLIELALLFPDMEKSQFWYDKAMTRLLIHVDNDVSASGVHKEHSPSYHVIILNLFKGINDFIGQFSQTNSALKNKVILMEDYLAYLMKPDGTLPILGDSEPGDLYSLNPNDYTSPKLQYVLSKGAQGVKPDDDAVFPDGGVGILRNGWNKSIPVYLLFTAAYHSNVHKHADDLSFVLTYGKTDFFVDSGKYNYVETDAYRKYFRSAMAHNAIVVDNTTYALTKTQINKSRILKSKSAGYYSYIVGGHDLYPGVKVKRTIIYLKSKNSILIRDTMQSATKHTYTEIFNIGKDVQIGNSKNTTFNLKSTIESRQLEFIQLTPKVSFKQYKGSTNPIAGWESLKFNNKDPISQLRFTNSGANTEYKSIMNLSTKVGVKTYSVKEYSTYTLYTIVYKDGTKGNIKVEN
ncbi:alginate lyase family protein [Neobacillus sp. LXY-1]|uniref:alginate lyase family protein n=1 Tax=Neobacillus sp. LXY-1 TaxID=3379133 RepID=UPI003EE0A4C1